MGISIMTSKGQITIPKEIREALGLKPSDRVIVTIEKGCALLKPLHGNILDLGGSVKVSAKEKKADFRKIREKVREEMAKGVAKEG